MPASLNSEFVGRLKVDINKVVLEENLELLVEVGSVLIFLSLAEGQVEVDPFDFLNCFDGDGHQRLVAARNCVASALEVLQSSIGDLHPSVEEGWVQASFILA